MKRFQGLLRCWIELNVSAAFFSIIFTGAMKDVFYLGMISERYGGYEFVKQVEKGHCVKIHWRMLSICSGIRLSLYDNYYKLRYILYQNSRLFVYHY